MGLILANNAQARLAQPATVGATTLVVEAGHSLPAVSPGGFYFLTLVNNLEGTERDLEIVKVTGMTGSQLTVLRGQDGTIAKPRLAGETAELRMNRALLNALRDEYETRFAAINQVLSSDDTALDELQEIVDFIKLNRADLDSLGISSIAGLESALSGKVDKVSGKGLSDENYTNAEKTKLAGIAAGAQVNVGTNLGSSGTGATRTITSSTGSNTSITYSAADVGAPTTTGGGASGTWGINVTGNAGTATTATNLNRQVIAGGGLSGGGTLNADRTLAVDNTVIRTTGDQSMSGVKTFTTALAVTGTSKAAGRFYGGTTDPTNTTRLNYDGNLHATKHVANTHNVGTGTTGFDIAYNSTTKSLDFNFVG